MTTLTPDILVVGAGLTGTLLSLGLQHTAYRVVLCDSGDLSHKTIPSFDARSIALNHASIQILRSLGLWESMATHATAIQRIEVSSQGQWGTTQLKSQPNEPLGWVVEMHRFYEALLPKLNVASALFHTQLTYFDAKNQSVTLQSQKKTWTEKPKLIVAADGTCSRLGTFMPWQRNKPQPKKTYAIVTNLGLRRAHQGQAFERFTASGPLALLPLEDNRMSLVWCLPEKEAKAMQQTTEASFLSALYRVFGYRLGWFSQVGQRVCLPLDQTQLPQLYHGSVVFIGNAAQTLHPIAGQGFNLGIRDLAHLIQCIMQYGLIPDMLACYQALREPDRRAMILATQTLLGLFQQTALPIRLARSLGLSVVDNSDLTQSLLIRYASGFGEKPPDLACGFSLSSLGSEEHA